MRSENITMKENLEKLGFFIVSLQAELWNRTEKNGVLAATKIPA